MSTFRNIAVLVIALVAWQYYAHNFGGKTKRTPQVSGYFHPKFKNVAEVFKQNVESGFEQGAAFSVYYKGEPLVDLWGGWAEISSERHWQEDTLSLTYSMVKGVVAMVMARLVDMGLLNYKKAVYHYWPEFGTEDKRNITVEMLLSHQAGLIGLDEKIDIFDYRDKWDAVEKQLAKQSPHWPPGTAYGYHAITFGMYADALVRKVDPQHRNLSQFFHDEIALPLDIEFYIGLPKEQYHRLARVKPASLWEFRFVLSDMLSMYGNQYWEIMNCWNLETYDFGNPDILSIGVPSVMGFGPARSVAKLYDYIANAGSIKAKRLLSPAAVEALQEPLTTDLPGVFLLKIPVSRGLFLKENKQGHKTIGHSGFGGSMAYADMTAGIGVTYSTNYLSMHIYNDPRGISLMDAFYESFETYKAEKTVGREV